MKISRIMRGFSALVLAGILAGCGYSISLNTEFFRFDKGKRTIESSELEKEVNRFESCIAETIKSDYTKRRRKGELTLAYSEHCYNGLYVEEDDTIFIPTNTKSKQRAIDAIPEEIAHTLTDDSGSRKGGFFSEDYQGPSLEEIERAIEKRFQQKDLLEAKKKLKDMLKLKSILDEEKRLQKKFGEDYSEVAKKASGIDFKKEDKQTREINEIGTGLTSEISSYQHYLKNPKARELYIKINGKGFNSLTNEETGYLFDFVSGVCSKVRAMGKRFCVLDEKISKGYGLELQTNPYDYEIGSNASEDAEKEIEKEFSSKEKFGKTIYSIANFHYGRANISSYEVPDEILEMLLKCRIKGKQMFKKLIEKYRVGREMFRDGCEIEEIKDKLRYANKLSYNGKEYSWPEAGFRIKGQIPDEFSREFLSAGN